MFVYGRTGSGKSTVVKFVCGRLPLTFRMANLRKTRTVFGCANLILEELGGEEAKSGQSCSLAAQRIVEKMGALASQTPFVLVLDEFDALFSDQRGGSSDFIYRLLSEQQRLREEGRMICIIAIANSPAELDGRIKSRIGSAPEIHFGAYSKDEVLAILKDRARQAFVEPVDEGVLGYCAAVSSDEFGDARRAIDLLKVAAELAGPAGGRIESKHIDEASGRLRKDRVEAALAGASYHLTIVCRELVRLTLFSGSTWHSTSRIYGHYVENIIRKNEGSWLGYRRVAELLGELCSMGLVESHTESKSRGGFGREYRLAMPPEEFTPSFEGLMMEVMDIKLEHKRLMKEIKGRSESYGVGYYERNQAKERLSDEKRWWKKYYGGA